MDRDVKASHDYEQRYGQDPVFPIHNFGLPPKHTAQSIYDYLKDMRECFEALADLQGRQMNEAAWEDFAERETKRMSK